MMQAEEDEQQERTLDADDKGETAPPRSAEDKTHLDESDHSDGWWGQKLVISSDSAQQPGSKLRETGHQLEPGVTDRFHAVSADDDDGGEHFTLVKKSIYKPSKKTFLSRFAPASTKNKYIPSDITGIVTEEAKSGDFQPKESEVSDIDSINVATEGEEGINVAIDRSPQVAGALFAVRDRRRLNAEDAALGGPSEVVIHSGDSEPGFATLNPVISSNLQRSSKRRPSHGGLAAPAMTKSSGAPVAKDNPILLEIPVAEERNHQRDRLLLIINALGATGLPKAEKFGTQSCLLEMKLVDGESGSSSSFLMRTEIHKKGGSEAQWNQQFTTTLRSKETQFLHVEVKTSSKILVGEADVRLDKVGDLFYDQHYPLSRSEDSSENVEDPVLLAAGQVHLQLKIGDAAVTPHSPPVIPPLHLPISSVSSGADQTHSSVSTPLSSKPIPAILLNGGLFFKIPFHNHNLVGYAAGPRRQWVAVKRVSEPLHLQITWGDPTRSGSADKKSVRTLDLALVTEIREGHSTSAFAAQIDSNVVKEEDKCFSLVTRARTLDLVAASKEEARLWVSSLRELLFPSVPSIDEAALLSARTIEGYKQTALSPHEKSVTKPAAAAPSKRMIATWRNRIFNLARHDRLDDILECLEDGCPIDLLETGTGDTLLMLACRLGNAQLVDLCLSRRAKNDPHPEFGETALQVAVNTSHAHCVGLLLSTAAKSDMDSEIVNHIDPNNDAPLHVAARHGDLACLQLLLHHGADICAVEEFGRTPLHCAVANGNLDCVAYLLDVGGDSVLNSGDHDGDTALHYAALSGNEAVVKLLLESAANVFATNIHNETAYDIAVREKQQNCAELVSKYFLTNEKGPASASTTRNEPASMLLGRTKQGLMALAFRDDDSVADDRMATSFVEPEIWRPAKVLDYDNDYPSKHHSPSNGSATSRLALSPSEQIRDALTRKHRANSLSPARFASPRPLPTFHSAREMSNYTTYSPYDERLVATERIDRDHFHQYPRYAAARDFDSNYHSRQQWEHSSGDRYSPYEPTGSGQAQPAQAYWTGVKSIDNYVATSPASVTHSEAWNQYNQPNVHQYPQQAAPVDTSEWETLYTNEGYPYYVNRSTGISQWEKPEVMESTTGTYTTQEDTQKAQEGTKADTLAPDAIIRLRLAEVRKQKSLPALESPRSTITSPSLTPTEEVPAAIRPLLTAESEPVTPVSTATMDVSDKTSCSVNEPAQSTAMVETSRYESRTGLKLAIDISSPPAQDARPVMIPSPRSRSPIKKFLESEGVDGDTASGSFGKSRASSPRGRSKNIQLIELKRANNLALALASFKIHDHYEQIVNDIVTMDERVVNPALLGCLQRFFPTEKEKQALQSFKGSVSALGKAERFFCLLFQVPGMQERIDMFLYKMEFARRHSSLLARVLVVKRACRDLVENYSFIQALEQFFNKQQATSFSTFLEGKSVFVSNYLSELDEKLRSFRGDLQKAMGIELVELQLQLNRLMAGIRPIRSFADRSPSSRAALSDERDSKAREIFQKFLVDTRAQLAEIESEYESMELWGDKLLAVFGESKATCHISVILEALVEIL